MKNLKAPPKAPKTYNENGKLIQDLQTGKSLHFDRAGIMGFLKSLNPLQFASETIAQITHYKIQIKNLEAEKFRIHEEAKIRHSQIDSTLALILKMLEDRRIEFEKGIATMAESLEKDHLEKQALLDSISNLTKNISDPSLSLEEKQMSITALPILTTSLAAIGEQSTIKLDSIVKNNQNALEVVPNSFRMLAFRGD